jgi:mRNA interferase MazF
MLRTADFERHKVCATPLKHPSWIFCDDLASVRKSQLTDFVGTLSSAKLSVLPQALRIALDIP